MSYIWGEADKGQRGSGTRGCTTGRGRPNNTWSNLSRFTFKGQGDEQHQRAEWCYNVASKASPRLPVKDVTTYQERLGSYSGKMLQHSIDSIVKVTWKRYFKVASRSSWWLPVTEVTMYIKSVLVVSKASLRLLKTYVAGSHQERLGTYSGKMLPHSIESIAEVTWERFYNIAPQALWRILEKDVTT